MIESRGLKVKVIWLRCKLGFVPKTYKKVPEGYNLILKFYKGLYL